MARRQMHEEHENHERWLVSYADFITLLFAFFVVMYAISQINEGKYRVLSSSLTVAFSKPDSTSDSVIKSEPNGNNQSVIELPYRQRREAQQVQQLVQERAKQTEAMKDMAVDLKKGLADLIDNGQVRVTESKRGIAIEVNASLLFPVGSATLDTRSAESLAGIARKLSGAENLIQIEGYTDNVPISSPQFPSNWELSAARAGTVVRVFEANGVAARRLVALGYGENRSVEPNETTEGRARNRRVTIQILADSKDEVATLPIPDGPVQAKPAP
ncbi:flagellar motor protein MotD [Chitinimonas sp. BJB300]|uniref:flagellar motor protein MotD n=1 Tax=Chitinimonas sp. BJB300 TaxID=1559339 RepID=UPI000C0D997B|nr:flagellar motor protein MotD [Chitinimonas sp. BJB300]PHV13010.1 flagellar motor protein MotD [Chitinimonas sp. BJB300]TSJ88933.1 flagellar motor protein MotD [Chitinimonas sp. BJB300]